MNCPECNAEGRMSKSVVPPTNEELARLAHLHGSYLHGSVVVCELITATLREEAEGK